MAILRSLSSNDKTALVSNPEVEAALRAWEERVNAARDEGRKLGQQEQAGQLAEIRAERAAFAEEKKKLEEEREASEAALRQAIIEESAKHAALIKEVHNNLEQYKAELRKNAETQAVELAVALARQILQYEVSANDQWMESVLEAARPLLPDRQGIVLRMHAKDAERVRALAQQDFRYNAFIIQDDAQLPEGTCLLESQGTQADASPINTWQRISADLTAQLPADTWSKKITAQPTTINEIVAEAEAAAEHIEIKETKEAVAEEVAESEEGEPEATEEIEPEVNSESDLENNEEEDHA